MEDGVRSEGARFGPELRVRASPPNSATGDAMSLEWFKTRDYRHLDLPVGETYARRVSNSNFVLKHSFVPLLHYEKLETRYKRCPLTGGRKIDRKKRPIKYAAHRDACILSYYAHMLNEKLEAHYAAQGLSEHVLAYRALGKGNYDFAAEALDFANKHAPVTILAFDVSKFFDTLDHGLLKQRLKDILGVAYLPEDWFRVFRSITDFHYVDMADLKVHPTLSQRLKARTRGRIASVEELKAAGIKFQQNPEILKGRKRGVPQGTPISAAASNLYMMDFDKKVRDSCASIGALYRRYSDDMLVICPPAEAQAAEAFIMSMLQAERLTASSYKTERTHFSASASPGGKAAQYLGFSLHEDGAAIRASSMARQWRKMRRAMRRAREASEERLKEGGPSKVFTKSLYRRFAYLKVQDDGAARVVRNFSSYGRRSAKAFGSDEKISGQVKRFERTALKEIAELRKL